jgi:hypothetical protein
MNLAPQITGNAGLYYCGKGSTRRLEFKLSIGFVHPGGFMLGWFMGQMMEQGFRRLGCAN